MGKKNIKHSGHMLVNYNVLFKALDIYINWKVDRDVMNVLFNNYFPFIVEAVVEFDYVAQEHDELTLRKGDVITSIKTQPGGWWEGTLNGKRGMFPDNFVKVIRND